MLELSESVPDLANKMLKTLLCILDNFQENILDKLLREGWQILMDFKWLKDLAGVYILHKINFFSMSAKN